MHYRPCQTVRDCPAVYPALFIIKDLDFETEIKEIGTSGLNNTYGFKMENGSFNGLIGVLERDEADIAIQVKLAFWVSYVRKFGDNITFDSTKS